MAMGIWILQVKREVGAPQCGHSARSQGVPTFLNQEVRKDDQTVRHKGL